MSKSWVIQAVEREALKRASPSSARMLADFTAIAGMTIAQAIWLAARYEAEGHDPRKIDPTAPFR